MYPTTPDGRYFVVKGRLWRCSNPSIDEQTRGRLVSELMSARRSIKDAKASDNPDLLKEARARVQKAKVALGERGPIWWNDGSPDLNRHLAKNTVYAEWYETLSEGDLS